MKQETKEKIEQLQVFEQNINTIIAQKQQYQTQNLEIQNALSELSSTDKVFQIIGSIMVASAKPKVKKDLNEKKEIVELRLKSLEKQEEKLRVKAGELQKEIMKEVK